MNEKSYVSLEQRRCLVCTTAFDTGAVLLDRGLQATLERHTLTGWGLCPEHTKLRNEGFVALVECDPARSRPPLSDGNRKPSDVFRTGVVVYVKLEVFTQIFDAPFSLAEMPCVFVTRNVIELLKSRVPEVSQ